MNKKDRDKLTTIQTYAKAGMTNSEILACLQQIGKPMQANSLRCYMSRHKIKSNIDIRLEKNPNWKGGVGRVTEAGHIKVFVGIGTPGADARGMKFIHRIAMEQKLGRPLKPTERVHHINYIKTDNHPDNLMLFASQRQHVYYEQNLCTHPNNPYRKKEDELDLIPF